MVFLQIDKIDDGSQFCCLGGEVAADKIGLCIAVGDDAVGFSVEEKTPPVVQVIGGVEITFRNHQFEARI